MPASSTSHAPKKAVCAARTSSASTSARLARDRGRTVGFMSAAGRGPQFLSDAGHELQPGGGGGDVDDDEVEADPRQAAAGETGDAEMGAERQQVEHRLGGEGDAIEEQIARQDRAG